PASQRRRLRPQFNAITLLENASSASFHSMTAKAERRFTGGFTLLSSFTWSHNIDFGGEVLNQDQPFNAYRDQYNPGMERGSANQDRRLAFVTSFVYELPFGTGKRWAQSGPGAWLLGGWQMGGILTMLSGLPLDHTFNVDTQNNGGRVRGNSGPQPNPPPPGRSLDRRVATRGVAGGGARQVGDAGPNVVRGPGGGSVGL